MSQPTFCCPGYVCSENTIQLQSCGEGYFCPPQSIEKIKCNDLTVCEERTTEQEKYGVILLVFFFFLFFFVFATLFSHFTELRDANFQRAIKTASAKRYRELDELKGNGGQSDLKISTTDVKDSKNATGPDAQPTFTIDFKELEYTLPDGLTIMQGVSGRFGVGRLCAVMGPSGAGKSTLFNLITGKAKRTNGQLYINHKPEELFKYKRLIGFVPQDDVMLRDMTVTDVLTFSARRRLPSTYTSKQCEEVVAKIVAELEIGHVAESIIGDERKRGISGGQRKRVNIGMELVAKPSLLFLDEPTTGLDASTALDLCQTLKRLCRKDSLTAAAIIHSPSPKTFATFDDFCLLGKGGRMIYFGPVTEAYDYFALLGFSCPSESNPADFYLEVSLGKVQSSDARLRDMHWSALFTLWHAHEEAKDAHPSDKALYLEAMSKAFDAVGNSTNTRIKDKTKVAEEAKKIAAAAANEEKAKCCHPKCRRCWTTFTKSLYTFYKHAVYDTYMYWFAKGDGVCPELGMYLFNILTCGCVLKPTRRLPPVYVIFWLCLKRAFKQVYGNIWDFMQEQVLHVGLGLFLAASANQLVYIGRVEPDVCEVLAPAQMRGPCTQPIRDGYTGTANFMCFAIGFAGIAVGSTTFGAEKTVFYRHVSTGLDVVPYFFAKIVNDLPRMFIASVIVTFLMQAQFYSVGDTGKILGVTIGLYWTSFSQGYFLSTIVDYMSVPLWGVVFTMFWCLIFSGINIRLTERSNQPGFVQLLFQMSPPRWAIEAFYINEMSFYADYLDISARLSYFQYSLDNYNIDIGAMFYIGLFWQGASLMLLKLVGRNRMK
uniref:ABC transporter domain-containing protein n=1 Tax=Amorphochlora amoebiformis TaxID=1561963 RepID=A0A7S0DJA6_9EUKA